MIEGLVRDLQELHTHHHIGIETLSTCCLILNSQTTTQLPPKPARLQPDSQRENGTLQLPGSVHDVKTCSNNSNDAGRQKLGALQDDETFTQILNHQLNGGKRISAAGPDVKVNIVKANTHMSSNQTFNEYSNAFIPPPTERGLPRPVFQPPPARTSLVSCAEIMPVLGEVPGLPPRKHIGSLSSDVLNAGIGNRQFDSRKYAAPALPPPRQKK